MTHEGDALPKGWEEVRLGDFVVYQKGKKPKKLLSERTDECNRPYVNIKAFERNIVDEYTDGVGCVLCEKNDFLMVWDGARSGFVGKSIEGVLGSTLVKINFPGINLDYAYYFLLSKYGEINAKAKGTGIPHVDPDLLWNYAFPLPPLAEQQRIVAKIEELFSELDKGVETLKTVQQQLKTYRQAVLKAAFAGRLTHPDLPEGQLPEGWELTKVKNIGKVVTGTTPSKARPEFYGTNFPFYKPSDLTLGENVNKSVEGLSLEGIKHCRLIPKFSTLVTCIGATIGKAGFIKCSGGFNQQINAIAPSGMMQPKFVYYYVISPQFQQLIKNNASATTLPILNKSKFENLDMIFCPRQEQQQVVAEIEARLSGCDQLEASLATALQQSDALRQAILKRAFAGRLVPQDPADEPAAALLARLRREKPTRPAGRRAAQTTLPL